MSPTKLRPPRLRYDRKNKRYYIIQNKVKRYIEEDNYEKISQAVKSGKLAYKTGVKKGPTWLSMFPEQKEPVNRDMSFLPGELTPIERRKAEKAKWEVYGHAVDRYVKEQEEYSKKIRQVREIENKARIIQEEKKNIKFGEIDEKTGNIGINIKKLEELLQTNKKLLIADIDIAKVTSNEYDKEFENLIDEYDSTIKKIMKETELLAKKLGQDRFYTIGYHQMFEGKKLPNNELTDLFDSLNKLELKIGVVIYKATNKPAETKEEPIRYELLVLDFFNKMSAHEVRQFLTMIGGPQQVYVNKQQSINTILADPKMSKIAQLAYIKYKEVYHDPFKPDDNTFIKISERIKNSGVVGFGESDYDGLYGDEIIKIMKPYKGFLGVIMNDEIPDIIESSLHYDRFGFIINKDNKDMDGSHWCAVFVDIPDGSIEYFDSFGDDPSSEVTRDMAELIKEHDINYLMKFKINGAKVQDLRTGSCGWFAMKFLIDRFNGVPFAQASGFKITGIGSKRGESKVSAMKKSFGYI